MELDFNIEEKGSELNFDLELGSGNGSGGVSEEIVKEIIKEETQNLQPKVDESLPTKSKEVVGAIKELYEREDKQGLTEEQVKEVVKGTVPDWAQQEKKPEYKYEEIKEKPTLVEGISAEITDEENEEEQTQVLTLKLEDKGGSEIARTQVTLPKQEIPEIDLSDYLKTVDLANAMVAEFNNPTITLTDTDQANARKYIGAVGAGDVTSATKAGLMMVGEGLMASSSGNGKVNIRKAEKSDIDTATNAYKPIVPFFRDYFTMKALSDCKDTTLWTDDSTVDGQVVKGTKTKACETIGALKPVLPTGSGKYLISIDKEGNVYTQKVGSSVTYNNVPVSNGKGNIKTNTPEEPQDCANKDYIDYLPDKLTLTDDEKAKWRGMIGTTKLYLHSMTDANGETITLIDSSSEQKTPLEMIEAFHANNVVHRNYKGYTIVRTTLFIAGMSAIQIEYLIYSTVTGISGSSITLDLSNSTDKVTEL